MKAIGGILILAGLSLIASALVSCHNYVPVSLPVGASEENYHDPAELEAFGYSFGVRAVIASLCAFLFWAIEEEPALEGLTGMV